MPKTHDQRGAQGLFTASTRLTIPTAPRKYLSGRLRFTGRLIVKTSFAVRYRGFGRLPIIVSREKENMILHSGSVHGTIPRRLNKMEQV